MTDDDGVHLQGREFKVSVTEKRSIADYENTQPHATIEGELPEPLADLDDGARATVRRELLALHRDLSEVVERAAKNRTAAEGHEDWSDPR